MRKWSAYRLYTVVPGLVRYIEQLTKWYVRLNRARLKGSEGPEDTGKALSTLYDVLMTLARLMAIYTIFRGIFISTFENSWWICN